MAMSVAAAATQLWSRCARCTHHPIIDGGSALVLVLSSMLVEVLVLPVPSMMVEVLVLSSMVVEAAGALVVDTARGSGGHEDRPSSQLPDAARAGRLPMGLGGLL